MKSGWIIGVTDLETKDQAYKLFLEERVNTCKRVIDIKNKYDSLIKDRFKVVVFGPYCELTPDEICKVSVKKNNKPIEDIFKSLADVDPVLISETEEEFFFEVPNKYLDQLPKLLEETREEVVS